MANRVQPGLIQLVLKTMISHTITYILVGIPMFLLFNYSEGFLAPELACWMRPTDDPWVMAGPLFQPIRGVVFALAFYPLREVLFNRKNGWLITWWVLVALGILSTFGPAPGSIEGLVYTILPVSLMTYLEVTLQSLAFSAVLYYWVKHPGKKWLSWVLSILFAILLAFTVIGLITTYGS